MSDSNEFFAFQCSYMYFEIRKYYIIVEYFYIINLFQFINLIGYK